MKGTIYLILGIIAWVEFAYHLIKNNGKASNILTYEVPKIAYLLIWAIVGAFFFYRYYTLRKDNFSK